MGPTSNLSHMLWIESTDWYFVDFVSVLMSFDTQMNLLQFKQETKLLIIAESISAYQVLKHNVIIIKAHIYKKFYMLHYALMSIKTLHIFNM